MSVVVLTCVCGREIRGTDPIPGSLMRCLYCGHERPYEGDGPAPSSPPVDDVGSPHLLPSVIDLRCTSCGSHMNVEVFDGDRIGVCPHCKSQVDLPEIQARTRRRKARGSDGSVRTEVTTEWQSWDTVEPGTLEPTGQPRFALNGQHYDTLTELKKQVIGQLPPDVARKVLGPLERGTGQELDRLVVESETLDFITGSQLPGFMSRLWSWIKARFVRG